MSVDGIISNLTNKWSPAETDLETHFLAYPNPDGTLVKERAAEAYALGIQSLREGGRRTIQGRDILGKGYCGIVLLAEWLGAESKPQTVALKARRTDAPKLTLQTEAEAIAIANRLGIGPKLYAHSDNFIVMEYLPGPTIYDWLQSEVTPQKVCRVLRTLLVQSFQLDQAGMDHGNLRCITEHVLFRGETPVIIDFSGSSHQGLQPRSGQRKPANVTTIIQGFFWGTILPRFIASYYPIPAKETLIPLLRNYKSQPNQGTFEHLLRQLQLSGE